VKVNIISTCLFITSRYIPLPSILHIHQAANPSNPPRATKTIGTFTPAAPLGQAVPARLSSLYPLPPPVVAQLCVGVGPVGVVVGAALVVDAAPPPNGADGTPAAPVNPAAADLYAASVAEPEGLTTPTMPLRQWEPVFCGQ
jgi:hypothetical protein